MLSKSFAFSCIDRSLMMVHSLRVQNLHRDAKGGMNSTTYLGSFGCSILEPEATSSGSGGFCHKPTSYVDLAKTPPASAAWV